MAEQIKADNEARKEWNRTVDETRASGILEEDIVAMRKELVSFEIKESIKANGFMPELLGKILKKAVDALKAKIKSLNFRRKRFLSLILKVTIRLLSFIKGSSRFLRTSKRLILK